MTQELIEIISKCSGLIVPNIRNNNFKSLPQDSQGKFKSMFISFKIERVTSK